MIDLLCAADAADGDAGDGVSGVGGVGGVGGGGGDVTTEMIEMKAERSSGEGGGEGEGSSSWERGVGCRRRVQKTCRIVIPVHPSRAVHPSCPCFEAETFDS